MSKPHASRINEIRNPHVAGDSKLNAVERQLIGRDRYVHDSLTALSLVVWYKRDLDIEVSVVIFGVWEVLPGVFTVSQ